MNCPEVRSLLSAHLDEELDVVNDAAVAAHLENCPACAGAALVLAEQRGLLQEKLTRHCAPPDLAAQIRAALPVSRLHPPRGCRGGPAGRIRPRWRRAARSRSSRDFPGAAATPGQGSWLEKLRTRMCAPG